MRSAYLAAGKQLLAGDLDKRICLVPQPLALALELPKSFALLLGQAPIPLRCITAALPVLLEHIFCLFSQLLSLQEQSHTTVADACAKIRKSQQ